MAIGAIIVVGIAVAGSLTVLPALLSWLGDRVNNLVELNMLGVGLAAAVLLDATIVRGVLLPAAMTLLGERCWYLPGRHYRAAARRSCAPF